MKALVYRNPKAPLTAWDASDEEEAFLKFFEFLDGGWGGVEPYSEIKELENKIKEAEKILERGFSEMDCVRIEELKEGGSISESSIQAAIEGWKSDLEVKREQATLYEAASAGDGEAARELLWARKNHEGVVNFEIVEIR